MTDDLLDLTERLARGDESAACTIYDRFGDRLIRLAGSRLDPAIKQKVSPEDIAQSVFKSFYGRYSNAPLELTDWDGLWSLLVRITIRKCTRKSLHFRTRKRDVAKEIVPNVADEDSRAGWTALARDPTPEEAVCLTDTLEHLFEGLASQRQREIVTLRLQGYKIEEIAEAVGRTTRTVHRTLESVRDLLASLDTES